MDDKKEGRQMNQLGAMTALAYVTGTFLGLQKHPDVQQRLVEVFGQEETDRMIKNLYILGNSFYPSI